MKSDVDPLAYAKRPDAVSLAVVVCHLAFVFCPIYLAAAMGPRALLIPLWLWFGLTMHGLLNLMHECAHYHVFHPRWGSDVLGRWVLAPLMLADFDNYRQLHWAHHRELGGASDPKYSYKVDIRGRKLLTFFLRCVTGAEALKKFGYQNAQRAGAKLSSSHFWIVRVVIVQSLFATSLLITAWWFGAGQMKSALVGAMTAYITVYLYGLASLTLFIATLRSIAEHQHAADGCAVSGGAALRNLACGPIERLIFGCYGFAEHATHHFKPAIPSYHLAEATKELGVVDATMIPDLTYRKMLMQAQLH